MHQNESFDLVIIGGGPAGYTGAIRAAQLGMKVACIEKRKSLGGTCLNEGCIPSKALLNLSHKYEEAKHKFNNFGIIGNISLDLATMQNYKDNVVGDLCKGIDALFAKNKVKKFCGIGKIIDQNSVEILDNNGMKQILKSKNILIATGSQTVTLPNIKIDEEHIISSKTALDLDLVPKQMVIVGGGYIGLELGSVWRRLGSEITVIEYSDRIVPAIDHEIGDNLHKILMKQGIKFKLNTEVLEAEFQVKAGLVNIKMKSQGSDAQEHITADKVLVSVGRRAYTQDLGLENLGIELNKAGQINVDQNFRTNLDNIYAVGDVIQGPMLAHKAEEEAIAVVEIIAGEASYINYQAIPSIIYTSPEVAAVGFTEEQLKSKNISYKVGRFPFLANSRARVVGEKDGLVKIITDAKTDEVLGAHIIGPDAGSLIAELTLGLELRISSEDIAMTCHAHPTFNEAVKEAALDVHKRSINY